MSSRTAAWLAWSLWTLSLALTILSLILLTLNSSQPGISLYYYWMETTRTRTPENQPSRHFSE
jgi:hypothetical protein